MPSENEKTSKLAENDIDTSCRLSTLRQRSQLDFEIDFYERILTRDPNYIEVLMNLGELFSEKGCYRRALQVDLRLVQLRPNSDTVMYNLACSYAMLHQASEALATLRRAVTLGFSDADYLLADPDLESLHGKAEFQSLVVQLAGGGRSRHVL